MTDEELDLFVKFAELITGYNAMRAAAIVMAQKVEQLESPANFGQDGVN